MSLFAHHKPTYEIGYARERELQAVACARFIEDLTASYQGGWYSVISLHGGGSYGNWQRHYFPLLDYKDKYRLVIATPNSPVRV